ncbi:MAG: hypothetical protein ACE5QV_07185, partial [Fidelibacterota bacterium]
RVEWNPDPGVHVRYRLFEESVKYPAVSLGYSSQGFRSYLNELKRYQYKSSGFFIAVSKNYELLGNLGFHGGMNRSMEDGDGDSDINLFIGLDKSINPEITLLCEYDFALNDNSDNSLGSGKGYLNAGLRWTFVRRLQIEFDFVNILGNRKETPVSSREIKIVYYEYF